jgi:hypothetical protein
MIAVKMAVLKRCPGQSGWSGKRETVSPAGDRSTGSPLQPLSDPG